MNEPYLESVQALIGEFFSVLGQEAEVDGEEKGRYLLCQVKLPRAEGLIRAGEEMVFINALQYVVNRSLNAEGSSSLPRVIVDVGEHRLRREERLVELGAKLAREVKETGEEKILEPLDPRERRVVHLAVAKETGVGTRSMGDEFYKNVVIFKQGEEESGQDGSSPADLS